MSKKRRYYRTAALLGPHEQQVAVRPRARSARQAISDLKIPWRFVVPLLVVVGVTLWVVLGDTWYLSWANLTVTGLSHPHLEQTIKLTADLHGFHMFDLEPLEAEERLASMPYFTEVEVRCSLIPTSCNIDVVERVPILVWIDAPNVYWVDSIGVAFPALADRPDLPVIRGSLPRNGSAYSMTAILQGVAGLAKLGIPVNELECTRDRGLVWTDPEGRRVIFGGGTEIAERWQTYQLMAAHFAETGIAVERMDVRFRDGIAYSLGRSW